VRSGCRGIRVGRRRRRGLTAALIVLAACGDNLGPPRLTAARFVYDDGSEQIDRAQLYDRDLQTLCAPERLSDGSSYCVPDAGTAIYVDAHCSRVAGRVLGGVAPPAYFATSYTMLQTTLHSHVYPTGAREDVPPTTRYELHDGECIGPLTLDDGFDYYAVGPAVDLARVRFVTDGDIEELVADGVHLPWRFASCDLRSAPDLPTATCPPNDVAQIAYYSDATCSMPLIHAHARPSLGFVESDACRHYYEVGNALLPPLLYERIDKVCVPSSVSGPTQFFSVGRPVDVPMFDRVATGNARLQAITIGPLVDELMHDTKLQADCRREDNRCVPAAAAPVQSWFTESGCGTPIEVAMVPSGGCAPPTKYARRGDTFFALGEPYTQPLFQLEPGDRCGVYVPPTSVVPYTLGAAMSDFAVGALVTK
jgi:hypothetical protein